MSNQMEGACYYPASMPLIAADALDVPDPTIL
jgi:hypothetical protein